MLVVIAWTPVATRPTSREFVWEARSSGVVIIAWTPVATRPTSREFWEARSSGVIIIAWTPARSLGVVVIIA